MTDIWLRFYQVDAFSDQVFQGNPAGVCPLDKWLPENIMQAIATENNLSETAFFVSEGSGFGLRWFTPVSEIDLCGHATLASAHVLVNHMGWDLPEIYFSSASGELKVTVLPDRLSMNFPSRPGRNVSPPAALIDGLKTEPRKVIRSRDFMAVLDSEEQVRNCQPDLGKLEELDATGIIITAASQNPDFDFVSRFFAPREGIPEDPVTGSAHCTLIPYWAQQLGKSCMVARQESPRGGTLYCELSGDRVNIAGRAATYSEGRLFVASG